MASYSMITRKMANVLYRARMDGKIEMTDAAVRMLYQCADAYYIHDDCWTEVEARLKEAVSRAMAGDMAGCQEAVDEACERHDRHWEERTARITPEAVEVEEYEAFDEGEEWDIPDDDWEVFEMTAKAEAQAPVEEVAVFVEREDGQQARVMVPDVGEDVWTCILKAYPTAYDMIDEGRVLVDDGAGYGFDETFRPGEDAELVAWLKEGLGFAVQVSDAYRPEEAHGTDVWCEGRFKDLEDAIAKARQEARGRPANPGRFRKAWVEDADGECVWSSDDDAEGGQ